MRHVRDVYAGVDPEIIVLIRRIQELEDQLAESETQRHAAEKSIENKNKFSDITEDVRMWTGAEFFRLFCHFYRIQFKTDYDDFQSQSFVIGQITKFINKFQVDKAVYYKFIIYLIFDDPFTTAGGPPPIHRMFNINMYNVFCSRLRQGKVHARNTDGTFQEKTRVNSLEEAIESLPPDLSKFVRSISK